MEQDLPEEITSVALPNEATQTDCVIKSGESVILLAPDNYKLPDGTTITTLSDCELQKGSSLVIYYGEEVTETQQKAVVEKPKKVERTEKKFSPPKGLDPFVEPENVVPAVVETQPIIVDSGDSSILAIAAAGVVTVAAVAVVANKASKSKRKSKIKKVNQTQQKRREERKKCDGNSEKIIAIMDETSKKIDESPLFEEKPDKHKQFLDSVELVEKELKDINKRIKKIEKRISPKR